MLDVGCGNGQALIDFETWGAERGKLAGIDLGPRRIELARRRLAGADLRLGDASELPWPDRSFDLVAQSMVFSSILDETMRSAVAREMMRVLRPGGAVLWYDFFLGNPRNHGLRRMPRATIAALFPGFTLDLRRTTLAPPLARRLAHRHYALPLSVQALRGLNSHYLGLLRPAVPAPRVRTNRFRSRSADRLATRAGAAAHPPGNGVSALGRVAARFPHHGLAQP